MQHEFMQYEAACRRVRENIATLLVGLRPPKCGAAYAAACATQTLAAALHHAAGRFDDPRWPEAFNALEEFLDLCDRSSPRDSAALLELRSFLAENADLLAPRFELARAS
jgi:hypothetical protein